MTEEITIEEVEQTEVEEVTAETTETDENSIDSNKVVEKLQKRLNVVSKDKNEAETKYEEALKRIEELEKGSKKGVKEQSAEEKSIEAQNEKDSKIQELENKLELARISEDVDFVLKESGLAVSKEELALVTDLDDEKAYSKVKTLIGLINKDRQQQAVIRNTGVTPKKTTSASPVTQKDFNTMTYAEKAELAEKDPEKFKEITGGV